MVIHRLTPEYIYARSRTCLAVRLYSSPSEIDGAEIVFWKRKTGRPRNLHVPLLRVKRKNGQQSFILMMSYVISSITLS